jgi:hypothetical protein
MSEDGARRSRFLWWIGLVLVVLVSAGLVLLFRVPLALAALRHGVFEKQADWVVRNAGEGAIPYLRGGLDDPDRNYAGVCALYLIGFADMLVADGRSDVLEEVFRSTNHVEFDFRPAYVKGSSALGFVRWTSEIGLHDDWRVVVWVRDAGDGARSWMFARSAPTQESVTGGLTLSSDFPPGCLDLWPEVEIEPSTTTGRGGSVPWFRSDDLLWLDRLLKESGRLTLEGEIQVRLRSVSLFKLPAAKKEIRVVESVSECGELPTPIDDPDLDAWVQKNVTASLSLFKRDVMLRLGSAVSNREPLCFTITLERDDGTQFVRPRHLTFQPGELMASADFQTGLELTEPGTYRMRVILEGTPEAALSRPDVTRYWRGRYESPWQTITIPER